ncbi:unnamed protein product [Heligmosomoides polygyrus]|uniref:Uncharacterized protein n=1 Tax=Heligmosomoides polygyrus TaxID=6339 RepID=A0A183G3R8_HELPZ|nr:unnamed protein product [Heligmosomoides polygyrus]
MDSLLLLCRVDAFLVRGAACSCTLCVDVFAPVRIVGRTKSLHSIDWEYIVRRFEAASKVSPRPFGQSGWLPRSNTAALKGLIPLTPKEPLFLQRWEDEYGETAKISGPASVEDLMMQARKIKYDVIGPTETRRHHPYTPPTTPEKNCSSEHATAGE